MDQIVFGAAPASPINPKLVGLYPEYEAGGFSRHDGTVAFHTRVNALLEPGFTVLDIGAGRGAQLLQDTWRAKLCRLRGRVAKVVGLDIDPAVLSNPFLDEAHVVEAGGRWPLADESVDLIIADWVLEHVADPHDFAAEVARVLRPGGWFCARTPNRWGLTGIFANLVPNRLHTRILAHLQPLRKEIDVFPTTYRMNTLSRLEKLFPGWKHCSYIANPAPTYFQRSSLAMRAALLYWRLTPPALHTVLYAFIRKGDASARR